MQKKSYFDNALYSLKALKENLVLYLPDLILFLATVLLALTFLAINDLTLIFSSFDAFTEKLKDTLTSVGGSGKFVLSLIILLLINLLVGLGTICLRYNLIRMLVKKEKLSFVNSYKTAGKYLIPVVGIKIIMFLLYLIPSIIFISIGLVYKQLLIFMIILIVVYAILLRFVFLFTYPTLFFKNGGAIGALKDTVNYFNINKKHVLFSGLFVLVVTLIFSILANAIGNLFSASAGLSVMFFIAALIKAIIDISVLLWSAIFLFRSY